MIKNNIVISLAYQSAIPAQAINSGTPGYTDN
jgi:hypothetical protein